MWGFAYNGHQLFLMPMRELGCFLTMYGKHSQISFT